MLVFFPLYFMAHFWFWKKLRQIPCILWVSDFHKKWTHGIKWIEHPTRSKIQNAKTEDANEYIQTRQAFSDTQTSECTLISSYAPTLKFCYPSISCFDTNHSKSLNLAMYSSFHSQIFLCISLRMMACSSMYHALSGLVPHTASATDGCKNTTY